MRISIAVGGALGLIGFALVVVAAGWLPAAGLFLALWGNNIQRSALSQGDAP